MPVHHLPGHPPSPPVPPRARRRRRLNRTEQRTLLTSFYILVPTLALLVAGLWGVGFLTSGVSANSALVTERFAKPVLGDDEKYVTQGGELEVVFDQEGDEVLTQSCTIAASGRDQDGLTVILTARHCLDKGPIKRLVIGPWSPEFSVVWPETASDYAFIRLPEFTPVSGSQVVETDAGFGAQEVCRQGFTDLRPVVCGRAWMWKGEYLTTADCYFGDSGGPLTTPDRTELLGVVSRMYRPRPGISLCVVVPTTTIASDINSGEVPGLTSFELA